MENKKQRGLRKGYTTGTCAAAASKAAAIAFLTKKKVKDVSICLPGGEIVVLPVCRCEIEGELAIASLIKDAGDDPDVTNGAEIAAEVRSLPSNVSIGGQKPAPAGSKQGSEVRSNKAFQFIVNGFQITVFSGKGIGIVTKPGLAISVGEPAINPVPRKMIEEAIREAITNYKSQITNLKSEIRNPKSEISVTISVSNGEEIAKKTMNARLGIIGGISILGTTGIVEPLSLSAYRHSITCAMDVAAASECGVLVFSTGRSSEKVAERELKLPEEAFVLVGDHMGFALKEVRSQGPAPAGFKRGSKVRRVIIVGQFGKFSKLAAGHFETHCSDSSIEMEFLANLAKEAAMEQADRVGVKETATRLPCFKIIEDIRNANTARQIFFILKEEGLEKVFKMVCEKVRENARTIVLDRIAIGCMLIGYDGEVVEKL